MVSTLLSALGALPRAPTFLHFPPFQFILLVNKQGQTRLAKYFTEFLTTDERRVLEGEVVRRCLARTDKQVRILLGYNPSMSLHR